MKSHSKAMQKRPDAPGSYPTPSSFVATRDDDRDARTSMDSHPTIRDEGQVTLRPKLMKAKLLAWKGRNNASNRKSAVYFPKES